MKRLLLISIIISLSLINCISTSTNYDNNFKIEILDFGTYTAIDKKLVEANKTLAGTVYEISKIKFINFDDVIYANIGIFFGIRYKISSKAEYNNIPIQVKVFHPKFITDNQSSELEEWTEYRTVNNPKVTGYKFDFDYELVPGIWTIELWYKNYKYCEKRFNVIIK